MRQETGPCAIVWLRVNQFDHQRRGGGGRKISLTFVEYHWLRIKYFIELWPQVETQGVLSLIRQQQPCFISVYHLSETIVLFVGWGLMANSG